MLRGTVLYVVGACWIVFNGILVAARVHLGDDIPLGTLLTVDFVATVFAVWILVTAWRGRTKSKLVRRR